MNKYRHRKGIWCRNCKKEIDDITFCSDCGGDFMKGIVDPFAILKDVWVESPVKWYNPLTWRGGYWKNEGTK